MFNNYYQTREWLEDFIPHTYSKKELGLARIKYLLKLLGNPEKKFKSIHVGGTAGKGSTAYYIAKLLLETLRQRDKVYRGYKGGKRVSLSTLYPVSQGHSVPIKVGLHLSPHLTYIGERMQIFESKKQKAKSKKQESGEPISIDRFVRLVNEIKPYVMQMKGSRVGPPSYFEILVAATFKYFADQKVDWAVVEVGLGGENDGTNVLIPKVSVITNIGLDHTDILGNSIEKIAGTKAGIIKESKNQRVKESKKKNNLKKFSPGIPVITGATGRALEVIKKVAKSKNAKLININILDPKKLPNIDIFKSAYVYKEALRHNGSKLAFSNELLAITAVSSLNIKTNQKLIKKAFKKPFAGRFEEIDDGIILDGAHSPDKVKFLINFLKKSKVKSQKSKVILVVAFKKGKEWKKMIDLLLKKLPVKKVIATQFNAPTDMGFFASVNAKEIVNYVKNEFCKGETFAKVEKNSQKAVFEAIGEIQESRNPRIKELKNIDSSTHRPFDSNKIVLITGSLYLVGEARTLWYLPEL